MDISPLQYLLAILAGIVAGIINTLAGSGSAVTLPMLIFLGLDPVSANATNRIGVIVQNVVGIAAFARGGRMQLRAEKDGKHLPENILDADSLRFGLWLTAAGLPGSLIGAYVATLLDKDTMNLAIGSMLVVVLITIFFNPTKWLRERSEVRKERPELLVLILFFAIGIYGGFIQAGVGVFLVTALVLGVGYTIVHANAVKLIFVLALNVVALATFIWLAVEINLWMGALMAVGQSIGAWAAVRFAVTVKDANRWVRYLLIVVVIYSILRFFGLLDLIFGLF
ncbi:MAG: sulfite exporter TauE/SafE family protein [Caldilineaceae bacterium SB0661_bin_32]|uniref:Probable membrane transporter protein n=1 Tax=Caldilineaceae bacterium SB0661_bin_32 TaxID=2605255 RepID=A0A6B1DA89_9CHLR|nr:sulfite exporter TauE/SafE family protein [Caldilineaceae bacterium SB0661_bin_32]